MEKFKQFTENLMKVILVPDESSDSVSPVQPEVAPVAPVDNFTKNVADFLGHLPHEEGETPEEHAEHDANETPEEEAAEHASGEEPAESEEVADGSEFTVTHDTDGLKINLNGIDFSFPQEIVDKIKEVLLNSDDSEESEEETEETTESPAIADAMFGGEEKEETEDESEEKSDDEEKVNESLVEDGFMKHMHDLHGLKKYLVDAGLIDREAAMATTEQDAASLRRKGYSPVYVMDSYEERGTWTLRVYDPVTDQEVYYYNSDNEYGEQDDGPMNPEDSAEADAFADADEGYGANEVLESKKQTKGNPWAICHAATGKKKTAKFERCVKKVKGKKD